MDASLRTNTGNPSFVLADLKLYPDASGGHCILEVQSGPFAARADFFFDAGPWTSFLRDLANLDRTLRGVARLGLDHEDPFVELRGGSRGQVVVSGLLLEQSANPQRLEFSFETDQTALAPFLADLHDVQRAYAA